MPTARRRAARCCSHDVPPIAKETQRSSTKIDIRSIIASLALVAATVLGAAAALAPAAQAELVPPPLPGAGELPSAPSNETVPPDQEAAPAPAEGGTEPAPAPSTAPASDPATAHRPATRVLRAKLSGRKLKLTLQCSTGGTVRVKGGGSRHFKCHGGRARAALKLKKLGRRHGPRAMRVVVIVRSGRSTTRVPLSIQARPIAARANISSASSFWNEVSGQCVSYGPNQGGFVRVDTTTYNGFGTAAPGEPVYWRMYFFLYYGGAYHAYAHGWEHYAVSSAASGSSGDGYMIIGGGGYGYTVAQDARIPARTWAVTGVQVWTQRGGYRFAWANNAGGGYGDVYSQNGFCYTS